MSEDEALVYQFAWELNRNKRVTDEACARVEARFGKQGAVDLAGICGYYTLLATELNMARYPVPGGGKLLPRLDPRPTGGKTKQVCLLSSGGLRITSVRAQNAAIRDAIVPGTRGFNLIFL